MLFSEYSEKFQQMLIIYTELFTEFWTVNGNIMHINYGDNYRLSSCKIPPHV